MKKYRYTAAFMILLMGVSLLAGCSKKTEETVVRATRVGTTKAETGTLEITGTYIGTVEPHTSVNVTPMVSGTVLTVNVKVGDQVKEGDLLCQFDDKAARLQLESAEDTVESAKAGKEAAEDQIESAKKQADASIVSMEGQVKTLRAQKESSEDQLEELEDSIDQLQAAAEAAQEGYEAAKKIYDSANALYINYQAFLSANPDCATTNGLITAATAVVDTPSVNTESFTGFGEVTAYSVEDTTEDPSEDENDTAGVSDADDTSDESDEDTSDAADSTDEAEDSKDNSLDDSSPSAEPDAAALEKQQTAAALLESLNEIPLTVEYLTETGLNTLKDQADQAESASTSAMSAYTQAQSSVAQLESGISQLDAQIEALKDNIDAAEDAADSSGSTKAYDAQIKAAKTGVESAQYQVDLYKVTAPIDGVIESVNVKENEISAQGYTAFVISDKAAMEVSFFVPEDVRDNLKTGQEVQVETTDGTVKGRVSAIATAVDQQKGLFKITAEITGVSDKEFLSNTSVSLSLVTNTVSDRILIPFDAVYYDNDQAYVFLVEDGKAIRRDVKAGPYNNDTITILEGLQAGEEVITTWGAGLKDGAPVEVTAPADGS